MDAFDGFDDGGLPDLEPLELDLDDRKQALPSFEEYSKGPKKPVPTRAPYQSKLPGINQGVSIYDQLEEKDKQGPLEKLVFRLSWAGIIFLVLIEIFINSPLFPQVRPYLQRFYSD